MKTDTVKSLNSMGMIIVVLLKRTFLRVLKLSVRLSFLAKKEFIHNTVKLRSLELGSPEYLPSLELIAQSRQNSYIIYIVLPRITRSPIARTLKPDLWSLWKKYSVNHTFSVEHKQTTKVEGRHVLNN
jgi:hypothetical protein